MAPTQESWSGQLHTRASDERTVKVERSAPPTSLVGWMFAASLGWMLGAPCLAMVVFKFFRVTNSIAAITMFFAYIIGVGYFFALMTSRHKLSDPASNTGRLWAPFVYFVKPPPPAAERRYVVTEFVTPIELAFEGADLIWAQDVSETREVRERETKLPKVVAPKPVAHQTCAVAPGAFHIKMSRDPDFSHVHVHLQGAKGGELVIRLSADVYKIELDVPLGKKRVDHFVVLDEREDAVGAIDFLRALIDVARRKDVYLPRSLEAMLEG